MMSKKTKKGTEPQTFSFAYDIAGLRDAAPHTFSTAPGSSTLSQQTKTFSAEAITDHFIGTSPIMMQLYTTLQSAAQKDTPTLIMGETGSGKSLCARTLYKHGQRSDAPLHIINAGSLSSVHTDDWLGLFETYRHDTILLDDIVYLPLAAQDTLYRALEIFLTDHMSATTDQSGNNAIIFPKLLFTASTDILNKTRQERFRPALFHRLSRLSLTLPPLRARDFDILDMCDVFMTLFNTAENKGFKYIDQEASKLLRAYNWDGNVRELKNTLHTIIILNEGDAITKNMLPAHIMHPLANKDEISDSTDRPPSSLSGPSSSYPEPFDTIERRYITKSLTYFKGNVQKTAKALQISPSTLYRKLAKWNNPQNSPQDCPQD